MTSEVLTIPQAAEFLQVSEMTIRRLVRKGEIPTLRLGVAIRIPRAALEEKIRDAS